MAQKTSWNGAALTESDINTYLAGEGGAWRTWTPTLTQSATVTKTVTQASYARYGRTIHFYMNLAITSSGTAANVVQATLPVTAASSGYIIPGGGYITDASVTTNYGGLAYINSTNTVCLHPGISGGSAYGLLGTVGFTAALASADVLHIAGTYQAAI